MTHTQTIQEYIHEPLIAPEAIHPLDARAIAETLEEMTTEEANNCAHYESLQDELCDLEDQRSALANDLRELTNAVKAFLSGLAHVDGAEGIGLSVLKHAVKQFGSEN